MNRPLTKRQFDALQAIRQHQEERGYSPTLEELGNTLGINRITAYGHVQALIQKGYLENLEPGASRSLDLTPAGVEALSPSSQPRPSGPGAESTSGPRTSLPLLGRIAAGTPLEVVESQEEWSLCELFPGDRDLYLLEVRGDSMIDDGIRDGDLVVVDRERQPLEGNTVVAILEDEVCTLKKFYREGSGYRLQPANPGLAPIHAEKLEIRGVVTGVLRRY